VNSLTYSIVVPTGYRDRYLAKALDDLARQDFDVDRFEIIVVDDTPDGANRALAEQRAAACAVPIRYERRVGPQGPNAARNTGIAAATGEIIAFVDDDCRFDRGWLAALDGGIVSAPRAECFGGPIAVSLEPPHPRWCGRDPFPITFLDHGPEDRYVDVVFSANCAVRRSALERIGVFDENHLIYGDEVEWMLRLRRDGGLVRYVAAAGVMHTRFASDVTVKRLLRSALVKARGTVALDRAQGIEQPLPGMLWRAIRLTGHAAVHRCWSAATHALQSYAYVWMSLRARRTTA
jgi:GT2 family glycosyltransferase